VSFAGIHQYIDRDSSRVVTEHLYADHWVRWLYSSARERMPGLFKAATSARFSELLSFIHYDNPICLQPIHVERMARKLGINLAECLDPQNALRSPRRLFERKIRYWDCRPMANRPQEVVAPADAKVLAGSLSSTSLLHVKEKFFSYEELLGPVNHRWLDTFRNGVFAVFRLTPEKYHYNHVPVSGTVVDVYELPGVYHSCNPGAVLTEATPFSKNKRCITVFDTNVKGGTGVGYVAMIEIVALMIGDIVQCYSDQRYDDPRLPAPGTAVLKGQPKSLYRPGSSVDVLLFQKGAVRISEDILRNLNRVDVKSRFTQNFEKPLVETDVQVRSPIACRAAGAGY